MLADRQAAWMYQDSASGQPRFSDQPLIPQAAAPLNTFEDSYTQPRSNAQPVRRPVEANGPVKNLPARPPQANPSTHQENLLNGDMVQQMLSSRALLPAVAASLLLLNHHDAGLGWLRGFGFIDTIALVCLGISAYLTGPGLYASLTSAVAPSTQPALQVSGLADNVAKLASAAQLLQRDPEPKRWLDMYYNMASDVDNLLQEMVQLRKTMQSLQEHSQLEPVKEKAGWKRLNSFSKSERGR